MWEELQAEVDKLPQARPQEGSILTGRRRPHHPSPFHARKQVVSDCGSAAGSDGQRGQELLELLHQEEASPARHRSGHPQAARRGRRRRRLRPHAGGVQRRRAHPVLHRRPAAAGELYVLRWQPVQHGVRRRECRRRRVAVVAVRVQPSDSGVRGGRRQRERAAALRRRRPHLLRWWRPAGAHGGGYPIGVELQHAELDGWPKPRRRHHHHHHHRRAVRQHQPPPMAGAGPKHHHPLLLRRRRHRRPLRRRAGRAQVVRLRVRRLQPPATSVQPWRHLWRRRQQGHGGALRRPRPRQLVLAATPPKKKTIIAINLDIYVSRFITRVCFFMGQSSTIWLTSNPPQIRRNETDGER
uniref:Uncharacterized protein n=1 Tax=Oryza barthii TaxID=65489 RepID=A0A0D3GTZ1_9ORYZ